MRITISLVFLLAAFGCSKPTAQQPATKPAPVLQPIDLKITNGLWRFELDITISSGGLLRSVQTKNKHFDPNEKSPAGQLEIHQGQLNDDQKKELLNIFDGFGSLSDEPYGFVPDDDGIQLRYGSKTVTGGSGVPAQVKSVTSHLEQLARSMPIAVK